MNIITLLELGSPFHLHLLIIKLLVCNECRLIFLTNQTIYFSTQKNGVTIILWIFLHV